MKSLSTSSLKWKQRIHMNLWSYMYRSVTLHLANHDLAHKLEISRRRFYSNQMSLCSKWLKLDVILFFLVDAKHWRKHWPWMCLFCLCDIVNWPVAGKTWGLWAEPRRKLYYITPERYYLCIKLIICKPCNSAWNLMSS